MQENIKRRKYKIEVKNLKGKGTQVKGNGIKI